MKTLRKVEITHEFVEFIPKELEERKLYISDTYKVAVHLCLCGCGNKTVTPLGGGGKWEIVRSGEGKISLIGSVGNFQFPCESHYIISKNIANFV